MLKSGDVVGGGLDTQKSGHRAIAAAVISTGRILVRPASQFPRASGAAEFCGLVGGLAAYVEPCIELFGAERCNFESNSPVDKMGIGYATLWNTFKRITAGCSHTEKLALYSGTAKRLYHLD